jgi:hypothetical protein
MRVRRERPHIEADTQRSLEAERDLRPAVGQPRRAALPQRTVGLQQHGVPADDLVEVRAADLLLAFDDPADADRERAGVIAQRADHRQPDRELAFVVGRATRKHLAVAQRRLERGRVPQLERVDRLDVVVVVEEDREAGPAGLVAVDGRSAPVAAKLPRLETPARQQLLDELRGLVERTPLGRDARLPAQQVENAQRILLHPA